MVLATTSCLACSISRRCFRLCFFLLMLFVLSCCPPMAIFYFPDVWLVRVSVLLVCMLPAHVLVAASAVHRHVPFEVCHGCAFLRLFLCVLFLSVF